MDGTKEKDVTVENKEWLAERFEEQRPHLRSVAYRMLGSLAEADDAIQESWLRLDRSASDEIADLRGWLTTVIGRVCLDMLRARTSRREYPADLSTQPIVTNDPSSEAELADSVGLALLVVLESLDPAERLAFVLHDMFGVPFREVGQIVGRSSVAARQLASRARRRVRSAPRPDPDEAEQRRVVDAFLAASRNGDFEALVSVLDPDVVFRRHALRPVEPSVGAETVARELLARGTPLAPYAKPVLVNGSPGARVEIGGRTVAVVGFTVSGGKIVAIDLFVNPDAH
jgi:RNA polymerase sigma factor (sigma-70 family)